MTQPEGFVIPGKEEAVCRLVKCLYGLKQASRAWDQKFNSFLVSYGLTRSHADPCVHYRHHCEGETNEEITTFILYVDDGFILSSSKTILTDMIDFLGKEFEERFLPADRYVGVYINRNCERRTIHLSQPDYIRKILDKYNMSKCNPLAIPADPHLRLTSEMSPKNEDEKREIANIPFQESVGSLQYLTHMTRPDISYAIN